MMIRTVVAGVLLVLATVNPVCGLWLATPVIHAQRAQSPLEIGDMDYAVVDGLSVIVITLDNTGLQPLEASGEFILVDTQGAEVSGLQVSTGELQGGERSVLAVPLNITLTPGRYTATLSLVGEDASVRANSGLREITVGQVAPQPTTEPVQPSAPLAIEDDTDGAGFPSWLLLLIGLTLTVAGIGYMRASGNQHKPIPEVSMIRKVKVESRPLKRPATIKPLLPPRRRGE